VRIESHERRSVRVRQPGPASLREQRGVALAVALIMLLLLTVLGITAMRGSIFELQMARNEESRLSAFERAQSIIDAVIARPANLKGGDAGDTNCYGIPSGCDHADVTLDDDLLTQPYADRTQARVTYNYCRGKVPRALNVSEDEFDGAWFAVEGTYDATDAKLGRSALEQGVLVLIRQGPQGGCD